MGNGSFHCCYYKYYYEVGEISNHGFKQNMEENNNNNSILDNREGNINNNRHLINFSIQDYDINSFEYSNYNNVDNSINNSNSNLNSRILENVDKLAPEKKRCTICLEDFIKFDKIINLSCLHMFHSDCIKTWMEKDKHCPICKNNI